MVGGGVLVRSQVDWLFLANHTREVFTLVINLKKVNRKDLKETTGLSEKELKEKWLKIAFISQTMEE